MNIFFIGKRWYTNRDAYRERYGRIFQLPWHWSQSGCNTMLLLVDYHTKEHHEVTHELCIHSKPLLSIGIFKSLLQAFRFRPLVIVASGDCYLGLAGYIFSRLLRVKFVFDIYDKYDEFLGYRKFFGFDLFHYLTQKSDLCFFANKILCDELGSKERHDLVILNGLDLDRFKPLDMKMAQEALGLSPDKIYVGYFGSMEDDRGVADLIVAIIKLRQTYPSIQLLLAGRINPTIAYPSDSVLFLGNIPFANVPTVIAASQVIAIPYRRSTFMDAGASNKIAEAIACNRPLAMTNTPNFTNNFPNQAQELQNRLASPGNPDEIADMILLQLNDPLLVSLPEEISWKELAEKALRLLKEKNFNSE